MREDRLDNIYTVADAANKLMKNEESGITVSYTHLTLPTNSRV